MNEDTSATATIRRRAPEETFALLGDDTRIAIVRALGETPDDPLSFSALRERVGTEDSGRFNYHLRKLRGSFVRKTDDGYELTYAGRQIVGAMHAGTYTANATIDAIAVDGACPLCDGVLEARYADETASVECRDCDEWYNEFAFPPGSLEGFDVAELPLAFDRWMHVTVASVFEGFCNVCAGRTTGTLVLDDEEAAMASMPAHAEFECERCGSTARTSGATPVRFHPGMEGFLHDHGFDARTTPSWELWRRLPLPDVELVSTDPPRLSVAFEYGGERLTATVDADASVTDVRREPAVS